jgi:3-phenylpropionate/trans-cinnamate dioxygenase ferredoxin reductase subunit
MTMSASPIVIVGAGQAGFQAAASLREAGYDGPLSLVGADPHPPYERPPLSKQFLAPDADPAPPVLRAADYYAAQRIDLRPDTAVSRIERDRRTVLLSSGAQLPYRRLILALGSTPRRLRVPGADHPLVQPLRSLADAEVLRARLAGPPLRLAVVGAGFIGLEVAAAARSAGHEVTVVEAAGRALARAVSAPVSEHLAGVHRDRGVKLLFDRQIEAVEHEPSGGLRGVRLDGGVTVPADLVVVGIGVRPETGLAERAGLTVADGVVVDEYLRTDDPAIHAIGDCARFPSPYCAELVRLESVQNAVDQAQCVAEFLARDGAQSGPYTAVPWFWSDQYTDKLQIAGITAGHDRAQLDGDLREGSFSVHCYRGGDLVGVESVNRPVDHIRARRQLAQTARTAQQDAVARAA